MTEYKQTIYLPRNLLERINEYLNVPIGAPEDNCLTGRETLSFSCEFANGMQMDIKCCGVDYSENENNSAWTEAVLFNKNGDEVTRSEPSDDFEGEWVLEYNDDKYICNVCEKVK